ncbi:hypothetical protein SAMN04515692_11672 [Leifsonia sp. CL147]|nr:hypothetical protein SAMN04515694_1165 [Leifsonia sp. CL154]SFL90131.1 hypothetical protein SAMN04515692_11672 [Leifsonia sp. CL147]
MEVSISPTAVLQGAAPLSAVRGSLPSGSLPPVSGVGDQSVDAALIDLEDWWTTMSTGVAEDIAALHQLVAAAASAHVARDRQAAADIQNNGDRMASFRVS